MKIKLLNCLAVVPLLAPLWEKNPPSEEDLRVERPIIATEEEIAFQAEGMKYLDPRLQRRLLHNFGETNHKDAGSFLLTIIENDPDPDLLTTALSQLHRLPIDQKRAARAVIPLLNHEEGRIRSWSHKLINHLPITEKGLNKIRHTAAGDPDANVRDNALRALRTHARHLSFSEVVELTNTETARQRAAAWKAAAATRDANKYGENFVQAATADPSPFAVKEILSGVVANNLEVAPELRQELMEHRHPSVRGEVARSIRGNEINNSKTAETNKNILLQLISDEDPEVRRTAIKSLSDFPSLEVVEKVVERFSDNQIFVRQEAEKSAVALSRKIKVAEETAKQLDAEYSEARYHACNVLGIIEADQFAPQIHQLLKEESQGKNIAAAVKALTRLGYRPALPRIAELDQHEKDMVRRAVTTAMGIIGDRSINSKLAGLIHDPDSSVRMAAIIAAGRLREAFFAAPLLTILNDTQNPETEFSAQERIAICWTVPRLRPIPEDVMNRIRRHALETVIAVEMGPPMHERPQVIAGAVFAFAEAARHDSQYQEKAEELISRFVAAADSEQTQNQFVSVVKSSPLLLDIPRQVQARLENRSHELKPLPAPTRSPQMFYREISQ